ncbi:hypothetical protein Taro_033542 [Colocasia esculenta]|uniref:Aminotransferase-like plant mobile domain-containing protein n=1 Tax=Colocasia esculenta TaxID=4460 RepID=A0A843W517_COLES|nr:hypothetical protein [Colocasia esculenta]
MEGRKETGEGSSRRKRQVGRQSSLRRAEEPPDEEEVPEVEMEEEEEEETALVVNVEEERKKRAKAMKSGEKPKKGGSNKEGSGLFDPDIASARSAATGCRIGAGRRNQRERVEEMGFGEILRMERMMVDPALTQALRSRWDTVATAFVFLWGHMIPNLEDVNRITGLRIYGRSVSGYTYPCYHELAERLVDLPVERRSSIVPRVALQESLGLYDAGKNAGESEDEYLERLARVSRRELAIHCRFLPLLEDLGEVGGYAWGAAFLVHQYNGLSASERQTSTSGFYPFLQVWAYLHLPALGRGDLARPGLVPIARRWDSCRDTRHLVDQLERLQEAIDSHPYLDPYLGEGSEGQPWLVQARPYFGRSVWLHALNLVLPLNLFLTQHSLGLRQSAVEFPIENWERKGKAVKSDATTDDAYLQAYALKYEGKVYKSARHQVDVAGEIASLRALLHLAMHDRETTQSELEKVRSAGAGGASFSRDAGGSPSLLEARLAGAERDLRLTTEHAMDLQAQRDQYQGQRDQLLGEI